MTVAKLEVFRVNMLLTPNLNASACRPVPSDIYDQNPEGELDTDMLFSANDALDDAWSPLFFDHPDPDPDDFERNDLHEYFFAEHDVDVTSDFGTQNPELQTFEASAPQQRCPYLTPPPSQGTLEQSQNEPLKPVTFQTQRMSVGDVLQVVEAGLKHATLKPSTRKVKSATVSSNEGFKSLSSIAPVLWVPDYHRVVASRAVLIPTISHAVANVSSRASTNLRLKEKVRQLARQQSHNDDPIAPSDVRARANKLQGPLSVQIWQGMTSALSSGATARKLQPFSDITEPNDPTDAYDSMEDMLDEAASDQESCTSCDESDFEDLQNILSDFDGDIASEMSDLGELGNLGSMRSVWSGQLENLPVDAWDSEGLLLGDSESDLFGDGLELEMGMLYQVMESSGGGNVVDGHQRVMSRDGSSPTPASIASEFEEIGAEGFDVECLMPELWS